jgi:hypothetical protein
MIICCCWDFPLKSANFAQETNVAERHISRFHWHKKNVRFHLKNNIEKTQKKLTRSLLIRWFLPQLQIGSQHHELARYISHQPNI